MDMCGPQGGDAGGWQGSTWAARWAVFKDHARCKEKVTISEVVRE